MHVDLTLTASTLFAFLLVLGRLAGAFSFVPFPGAQAGPTTARVLLALACTFALYPRWPVVDVSSASLGLMVSWILSEAALGIAIGLLVGFIGEALIVGMQMLSLQAGYGYASVVDPNTQADSGILPMMAQITAGLLFFATGLDQRVIMAFALSLDRYPPGSFSLTRGLAESVILVGSNIFSVGLRLAFPVIGLLLMTDVSLALLGRVNAQLQLVQQAFSAKMLLTLVALSAILIVVPSLYESFAAQVFNVIREFFLR
ncbi:MAG TPA: flagellar biosynthetic protein FliR [Bryobacteraceae bacterium]|nr:flagellar biosynthetic protein FliR [Bryobacteraceae bacterium]